MFNKKKKNEKGLTAILCNSSLLTSNQLKEALESDLNGCRFSDFYITQFPWDAQEQLKKYKFDYLFVDEVTETSKDLRKILSDIRQANPSLRIILLTSYVSELALMYTTTKTIDAYILMPFQASHVIHTVEELQKSKENEIEI